MRENDETFSEMRSIVLAALNKDEENFLTAIYFLERLKTIFDEKRLEESEDTLYTTLLKEADSIKVTNPFNNTPLMVEAYKKFKELENIDWEKWIAEYNRYNVFEIDEWVMEMFEAKITKDTESVLIDNAESFSPCVKSLIDKKNFVDFVLTSDNVVYQKIFEEIFKPYKNVKVVTSDKLSKLGEKRFDLILSNTLFEVRRTSQEERASTIKMNSLARKSLKDGGKFLFTAYNKIFSTKLYENVRKYVEDNFTINEITELNTRLSRAKMYFVDVQKQKGMGGKIVVKKFSYNRRTEEQSEEKIIITREQLENLGSWNVDKIFALNDEDFYKFHNSPVNKSPLGEVADIFRGKMLLSLRQRNEVADGNVALLNISNLGEYGIDYTNVQKVSLEDRKIANYLLQEGDVLISARGTVLRSCVFHEQKEKYIASANLIVIRPKAELLDGTYLQLFLTSPIGMKSLKNMQEGTILLNTSAEELQTLLIPLPEIAEQKATAKEYSDELAAYQTKMQEAEKHWQDVLKKLQEF